MAVEDLFLESEKFAFGMSGVILENCITVAECRSGSGSGGSLELFSDYNDN